MTTETATSLTPDTTVELIQGKGGRPLRFDPGASLLVCGTESEDSVLGRFGNYLFRTPSGRYIQQDRHGSGTIINTEVTEREALKFYFSASDQETRLPFEKGFPQVEIDEA